MEQWGASWRDAVGIHERYPVAGKFIEIWGPGLGVAPQVSHPVSHPVIHVIDNNEDEVGPFVLFTPGRRDEDAGNEKQSKGVPDKGQ